MSPACDCVKQEDDEEIEDDEPDSPEEDLPLATPMAHRPRRILIVSPSDSIEDPARLALSSRSPTSSRATPRTFLSLSSPRFSSRTPAKYSMTCRNRQGEDFDHPPILMKALKTQWPQLQKKKAYFNDRAIQGFIFTDELQFFCEKAFQLKFMLKKGYKV